LKGFLKFFVWIEIFNLTLQTKSPINFLKILIFNIPSVKPNIKNHGHDRLGFIFFILHLSSYLFFSFLLHSLIFVYDPSQNQASSSLLILKYVIFFIFLLFSTFFFRFFNNPFWFIFLFFCHYFYLILSWILFI